MTIRKKLIFSHLCMILVPIFLSIALGAALFHFYGSQYWDSPDEMLEDLNLSDAAEWTIYECADQYSFGADFMDEDYERDAALAAYVRGDDTIWSYLSDQLAGMGYQVQIKIDDKTVFDNLTQSEQDSLASYNSTGSIKLKNRTISQGSLTIINSVYDESDQLITITAVSHTAWRMTLYLALYVLFVLLLIIATNLLLMHWLRKSIMTPLSALQCGTRQIAEGNLESGIAYHKKDEFGDVCRDFDQMRLRLKQSVDAQAQYEKDRQEMLSGISHDLRTPLTSIKGYAEGLQEGIANTEEKRQRYYNAIHVCSLEMEALLNSLSTFSRLESKTWQFHLEPTDMAEYLERLTANDQGELLQRNAALLYENHADRTKVEIDRQEMQRVFRNLFENSIRYRMKATSAIHIQLHNSADQLVILVRDDGPGVLERELSSIFNLFYRGDESRTKAENGSGLGLAIVKRIVEGHHGSIRAYNDKGLVIEILLPLA